MIDLGGKAVDLVQLAAELTAAGVAHRGLGTAGGRLYTYDADGAITELPPAAAAVVAAHVPPPPPAPPDFGADVPQDGAYRSQAAAAVAALRDYLAQPAPTAPQTVAALKLTIRAVLWLLRRQLTMGG